MTTGGTIELQALQSGRRALALGAWEQARQEFERLLAAEETPEALEGLGWARYWLGQGVDSVRLRERACEAYRKGGRPRDAARVATALAVDALDQHGEAVATGWLELAHRLIDGLEPGPEHGWLTLWEGQFARMLRNDVAEARRLGSDAGAIGRALGLADLELLGGALEGLTLVSDGQIAQGMRQLDGSMAGALLGETNDLYSAAMMGCFLLHACEWVRDYNRLTQWSARFDAFAERWNIPSIFAPCRTQYGAMLIGRGHWAEAEALLQSVNDELLRTRPWFATHALEQLGELRRRQGRWDEAEELFRSAGARGLAFLGRAQLALDRGAPADTLVLTEQALQRFSAARWSDRATTLHVAVRARLALADFQSAVRDAGALGEVARAAGSAYAAGLSHHADGLLALHMGNVSAPAFGDAIAAFETAGAPYEIARVRLDLARALHRPEQPELACREAKAALAAFRKLGAARDAAVAETLCRELATPPGAAARGSQELTQRECEVLRLVADGLGDRDVAGRLGISEHTVHRHLANILTKLDKPSRAAAVAHAIRRGLL